jgi:hypothetical protein
LSDFIGKLLVKALIPFERGGYRIDPRLNFQFISGGLTGGSAPLLKKKSLKKASNTVDLSERGTQGPQVLPSRGVEAAQKTRAR